MEQVVLNAKTRTQLGKQSKHLREQSILPAILYGKKNESKPLQLDQRTFEKIFKVAGESTLIDLTVDGKNPMKVLIQDIARDPVEGTIIHVDFHHVDMTEKIHTDIVLKFVGTAPAVKERGGVFVANLDKIEVECLPKHLVHEIEVDVSGLDSFNDNITVGDLKVPEGVTVKDNAEEVVAMVSPPRSEKELEDLQEEVTEDVDAVAKVEGAEDEEEKDPTEEQSANDDESSGNANKKE